MRTPLIFERLQTVVSSSVTDWTIPGCTISAVGHGSGEMHRKARTRRNKHNKKARGTGETCKKWAGKSQQRKVPVFSSSSRSFLRTLPQRVSFSHLTKRRGNPYARVARIVSARYEKREVWRPLSPLHISDNLRSRVPNKEP